MDSKAYEIYKKNSDGKIIKEFWELEFEEQELWDAIDEYYIQILKDDYDFRKKKIIENYEYGSLDTKEECNCKGCRNIRNSICRGCWELARNYMHN